MSVVAAYHVRVFVCTLSLVQGCMWTAVHIHPRTRNM